MRSEHRAIVLLLITAGGIYVNVALVTFAWRHPWLTDTQRIQHIVDVLLFNRVPR